MHFDTFIDGKSEVLFRSSTYDKRDVERGRGGPTGMSSVDDVMYFSSYYVLQSGIVISRQK